MQIDLPKNLVDSLTDLAEVLDTNVQTLVLYSVQTYLYSLKSTQNMKDPHTVAAFAQWHRAVQQSVASAPSAPLKAP